MDRLQNKGLILPKTRRSRLSNTLVIIVAADSPLSFSCPRDLAQPAISRLALANPKAVPAGVYARQFLLQENLWDALQPKIVPTANVRGALAAVESGNAEAAIVYKTDAAISKRVKVAWEVPARRRPEDQLSDGGDERGAGTGGGATGFWITWLRRRRERSSRNLALSCATRRHEPGMADRLVHRLGVGA